jgi:hypothetical protein
MLLLAFMGFTKEHLVHLECFTQICWTFHIYECKKLSHKFCIGFMLLLYSMSIIWVSLDFTGTKAIKFLPPGRYQGVPGKDGWDGSLMSEISAPRLVTSYILSHHKKIAAGIYSFTPFYNAWKCLACLLDCLHISSLTWISFSLISHFISS